MATKTIKAKASPSKELIPGLTNLQAYNLMNVLESAHCRHVTRIYITGDGYYFSQGNDLHELVDLDAKVPSEALLLKQGKKQKRILLPGKYIGRKQVIGEYSREEILEHKDEVITTFTNEQKLLKAKQKAGQGDEDNAVKTITEALLKLKS